MDYELKPYGKTQRFSGLEVTITEKLDGTNACVVIKDGRVVGAQSRNRKLVVGDDNFGFAGWVEENKEKLLKLGNGYHYGEWYGEGIQKNPHNIVGKKFAIFNTFRPPESLPDCVEHVPVLYVGPFLGQEHLDGLMQDLQDKASMKGSIAEGVILYFHSFRTSVKYTFANNKSKWELK